MGCVVAVQDGGGAANTCTCCLRSSLGQTNGRIDPAPLSSVIVPMTPPLLNVTQSTLPLGRLTPFTDALMT